MIRLFFGKSGSGKNYWCQRNCEAGLSFIVPYTTRPPRSTEQNGVDYWFTSDREFAKLSNAGQFMETRKYDTAHGVWHYATPKLMENDLQKDWCGVVTIPVARKFVELYGSDLVELIYVECAASVIKQRVQRRGTSLDAEFYRRVQQDEIDFSKENILALCNFYKKPIDVIHNSLDKPTFSKIWPEKWEGKNGTI